MTLDPTQLARGGLTHDELAVIDAISDAWALFVALPRRHPMELEEGVRYVHELTRLVMARVAVRAHPTYFRAVEGFK